MARTLPRFAERIRSRGVWGTVLGCLLLGALTSPPQQLVATETAFSPDTSHSLEQLEAEPAVSGRIEQGLLALYDFAKVEGARIAVQAGALEMLELRIDDPQHVQHSDAGLEIQGKTLLRTAQPARALAERLKTVGQFTLEVWLQTADVRQEGPARIVSLSRNANERNFTLGQHGETLDLRLRTTKTSGNGIPSLSSPARSLTSEWTHVVYTFQPPGEARLFLNGKLAAEQKLGGDLGNWDTGFELALGNELSGDRPWRGTLRLVALYERALTEKEAEQNFRFGRTLRPPTAEELLALRQQRNAKQFELHVAPLLAQHCLECHDTLNRQGGLDLSRKTAALAGGDSGRVLDPAAPASSRLWELVAADQMPHDRDKLSATEKQRLKQWLDGGATWSLEQVDAALYAQGAGQRNLYVQRLTVAEYVETVRATLGVDIAQSATEILPRDLRADGFSNTAYNLSVDLAHIEAYARLAELVVDQLDLPALVQRYTKNREVTDENLVKVITPLGRKLLRGPVTPAEVTRYCGVSTSVAAAGGDIHEAVRYIIQAMLQSPRFLYRMEQQPAAGTSRPVNGYELASRLSYILWGGPPDDALLEAAEKGQLDAQSIAGHAPRMLDDPRAVKRSQQFVSEWLDLGRLENLRPAAERYPNWQPALAADMRQETLAFFEEIVWKQNRPLAELLNAQVTFVTPELAAHYRLPPAKAPEAGSDARQPARYELTDVPARGGLLTHGSVLTVGGDDASMVTRGLFVMHELLRGVVRDPPPCVDATPVPSKPGLTQRMIAESRIANRSCSGCHTKFETLAYALEPFDGLGTLHEQDEHGNPLRDDGQVLFPGDATPIGYRNTAELMDLLAGSERVRESFTWKLTQFAIGRPLGPEDAPVIAEIHRQSQENGGTYRAVLTAIVTSELVTSIRGEPAEDTLTITR
jgi:hypothetical protein